MSTAETNDNSEPILMQQVTNIGKPVWIILMVMGFIWWWPAGVAIFAYLIWSGRLGAWSFPALTPRHWFSSGNTAFDDYRADVITKLEKDQHAFGEYIEKLRAAKDHEEFDAFMKQKSAPEPRRKAR